MKKSTTIYDTILTIIVFLMFFLRYYEVPFIRISFESLLAFLGFTIAIILVIHKKLLTPILKNRFTPFVIWTFGITILYYILNGTLTRQENVSTILSLLMFSFLITYFLSCRDYTVTFYKVYNVFFYITLFVYLLQWLLLLLGVKADFHIPFLNYSNSWKQLEKQVFGMDSYPTSLFNEPSHLCIFLLPLLAITLFGTKKKYLKSLVISTLIVSTLSGNGIVCVALIWSVYVLYVGEFDFGKRLIVCAFAILAGFAIYSSLSSLPRFSHMMSRLFVDTTGSSYVSTKADYRIYRGFELFGKLPLLQKILGVGYGQMEIFCLNNGISSIYDKPLEVFEYFSMLTGILNYTGLIGFFLFSIHYYTLFKNGGKGSRGVMILFLALMFSSSLLFSPSHVLFVISIGFLYNNSLKKNTFAKESHARFSCSQLQR